MPITKNPAKPRKTRIMTTLHRAPTLPTIEQDSPSAALWELCNDAPVNRACDDAPDYSDDALNFMLQIDVTFL